MANIKILSQFKGDNSCTTEASLAKLNIRQHLIAIHICSKFHKIPVSHYLVMAYFINFKLIQGQ